MGIISSCPHLLHAVVESGGKSPGMKIFAPQPRHETILSGFRLSAAKDIFPLNSNTGMNRNKFYPTRADGQALTLKVRTTHATGSPVRIRTQDRK
jgi:hypothetical protein